MRHINDDASSTSSERYEKDVTVLNRCFDDIERFIARLQHAATARRELERRRKYVNTQINLSTCHLCLRDRFLFVYLGSNGQTLTVKCLSSSDILTKPYLNHKAFCISIYD